MNLYWGWRVPAGGEGSTSGGEFEQNPKGSPELEDILEKNAYAVNQGDASEEKMHGFPLPLLGPISETVVGDKTGNQYEDNVNHGVLPKLSCS